MARNPRAHYQSPLRFTSLFLFLCQSVAALNFKIRPVVAKFHEHALSSIFPFDSVHESLLWQRLLPGNYPLSDASTETWPSYAVADILGGVPTITTTFADSTVAFFALHSIDFACLSVDESTQDLGTTHDKRWAKYSSHRKRLPCMLVVKGFKPGYPSEPVAQMVFSSPDPQVAEKRRKRKRDDEELDEDEKKMDRVYFPSEGFDVLKRVELEVLSADYATPVVLCLGQVKYTTFNVTFWGWGVSDLNHIDN